MNKILLFIKVPPPTTGATTINKQVLDSLKIKENFIVRAIPISYMNSRHEMGKIKFSKLIIFFNIFVKLISELISRKPDLIYFQISPRGIAFIRDALFVSLMKVFRKKIVFHIHGKGILNESTNFFKRLLYIYVFKNSYLICLSNLLTYDVKPVFNGKIYIVPNGIPDIAQNLNFEFKKSQFDGTLKILFISNLIINKGILDLLDALVYLKNKKINFKVTIIGAEADLSKNQLLEYVKQKRLSQYVEYVGAVYGKQKSKYLEKSDILVFPTKNETFGIVLLEAMQMGVPVIATKEGAIPEIVEDGKTGFLIDKDSPQQLAEKIIAFSEKPELIVEMGIKARKKYEHQYTLEKFEENLVNTFKDILNKE